MSYPFVQASRDRAATGRSIATTLSGIGLAVGLLVARLGTGVPVPIAMPPAVPAPVAIPGGGHPGGGGHRLLIPADAHGSCFVTASINGARFDHVLLDSGMNGYIGLGRNHAARAGFDPETLAYDQSFGSANGEGRESEVRLREFRIGSFVLHDVPAVISEQEVFAPLVGIEILQRLGLRLAGDHCEIRLP
jgi:clan AA aspartic protease (TIGR02281 family)